MKNLRKRKSISTDVRVYQNNQVLLKHKEKGFANIKRQSSINWQEVKIILDATSVANYLNNKKFAIESSTTDPANKRSLRNGKILLSDNGNIIQKKISIISETNKTINDDILQKSNFLLEPENSADNRIDDLLTNENFAFVDIPIKQEDHNPIQNIDVTDNDLINETFHDKFTDSTSDDLKRQDNKNTHSVILVKTELDDAVPESNCSLSDYENISIGKEFIQQNLMPNCDTTELINQKNKVKTEEISNALLSIKTRPNRKKKKCLDCDDCYHGTMKKKKISTQINNKQITQASVDDNFSSVESRINGLNNDCSKSKNLSDHENTAFGKKFIQQEVMISCHSLELINRENNNINREPSSGLMALKPRSSRKKKKCLNCDDSHHGTLKKTNISTKIINNQITKSTASDNFFSEKLLKTKLNDELFESRNLSDYENIIDGKKFSYQDLMPNYGPTKLINRENNVTKGETSSVLMTLKARSSKKKKCLNDDDSDHRVAKNSTQVGSKEMSKSTNDSNSSVCYSNSNKLAKKNRHESSIKAQPLNKRDEHSWLFSNDKFSCLKCGKIFKKLTSLAQHERSCLLEFSFKCKFCFVSVNRKFKMKRHIKSNHLDKVGNKNIDKFTDEIWKDSIRNVKNTLQREGNKYKQEIFASRFLKAKKKTSQWSKFVKLYCVKCNITYNRIKGEKMTLCPNCSFLLIFQCDTCKKTGLSFQTIWWHVKNYHGFCDVSLDNRLNFIDQIPPNASNGGTSNELNQEYYHCNDCVYRGVSKAHIRKHIIFFHLENHVDKDNYFACNKCNRKFGVFLRLKKHEVICGNLIRFPCKFCPKTFQSTMHLRCHLLSSLHYEELGGQDVDTLVDEMRTYRRIVKEISIAKIEGKFKTGEIDEKVLKIENLQRSHDIRNILKQFCVKCKTFSSNEFDQYCSLCCNVLLVQCQECTVVFSKYSTAWEHATQTCKNRKFTLSVNNPVGVSYNAQNGNSGRKLYCDYCGFSSKNKSAILKHIVRRHQGNLFENEQFDCSRCDQQFPYWNDFQDHKLKCRMKYFFKCCFCSVRSLSYRYVKNHIVGKHAKLIRSDELDQILKNVLNNKIVSSDTADKSQTFLPWTISGARRLYRDTLRLVTFYCSTCNKHMKGTLNRITYCPKCSSKLKIECRGCGKSYITWKSIRCHMMPNECSARKNDAQAKLPSYQLDHSYACTSDRCI